MSLSVEDRLDLADLYARYALLFDSGRAQDWAGLFTPDGRFHITGGPTLSGTGELARFAERRFAGSPGLRHLNSNVLVESDGAGGATGSASVVVLQCADDGAVAVLTVGDYADELVRLDSAWQFRRRTYSAWGKPDGIGATLIGAPEGPPTGEPPPP